MELMFSTDSLHFLRGLMHLNENLTTEENSNTSNNVGHNSLNSNKDIKSTKQAEARPQISIFERHVQSDGGQGAEPRPYLSYSIIVWNIINIWKKALIVADWFFCIFSGNKKI